MVAKDDEENSVGSDDMDQGKEEVINADDESVSQSKTKSNSKAPILVLIEDNNGMSSSSFQNELLYYEVIVPCTDEGLILHLTKYDGDIYGTAIEGYRHHANGDLVLVEQKKDI